MSFESKRTPNMIMLLMSSFLWQYLLLNYMFPVSFWTMKVISRKFPGMHISSSPQVTALVAQHPSWAYCPDHASHWSSLPWCYSASDPSVPSLTSQAYWRQTWQSVVQVGWRISRQQVHWWPHWSGCIWSLWCEAVPFDKQWQWDGPEGKFYHNVNSKWIMYS